MKKVELLSQKDLEYVANVAMQKKTLNKGIDTAMAVMMAIESIGMECSDHLHSEVMSELKSRTNSN